MLTYVIDVTSSVSYWFFFAFLNLIYLTYQDYKHKMTIDDKYNLIMTGITLSLISHIKVSVWYLIFIIILTVALSFYLSKYKVLGDGDISSLNWIILGLGIINIGLLVAFLIIFAINTTFYMLMKIYVFKYKEGTPFFGVILITYILIAAMQFILSTSSF